MKFRNLRKIFKKSVSSFLALTMLAGVTVTAYGAETATPDLTQNLMAYYDFEDVSGTEVPNKSGDNYKGTLNGSGVTVEDSGVLGKSLKFGNATDSYMSVSQAVNMGTTSYSISCWYKYDTSVDRNKSVILFQQSDSGRTLVSLETSNKYMTFVNQAKVYSTSTVNVNKWQHITYTYDTETKKVKFYINGVLDSEQAAGDTETDALTNLLIGRHKNSGTDPDTMKGFMDEIRVYNKVVTDAEAQAIYQEKAGSVLFFELPEKIDSAIEMYETKSLEDSAPEAVALKAAIEEAQSIEEGPSYAVLLEVIAALEEAMAAYRNGAGVTITLDPSVVERTLDDGTFGINHRYAFNGYGSFDSETMEMRSEFVDLYEGVGFGSIRYPGGTISNLFQWKASIGPKENRVKQIHGFYNNQGQNGIAPNFGLTEIANFAYDERIQSEIIYVYGLGRGSAQDAADLVEYLNAPVGSNPNGGVAWAQVRANNGRQEPYKVRYFEIGNEMWQGGGDGTTSQQYWLAGVPEGAEKAYINGGTASFTKQYAVLKDNWNVAVSGGTGEPGQVRYMRYANPNPMTGDNGDQLLDTFEAVVKGSVSVFVNDEEWQVVDTLEGKASDAKVVAVDYRDGSLHFGDGVTGAIPQAGQSITVSYSVQRDGFVAVSRAMKETTQQIMDYYQEQGEEKHLECYAYSSFETTGFINTMRENGYDEYYDGFTIHPYSGTPSGTGEAFYDNAMQLAEGAGTQKVVNFVNMLPDDKVPVISEFGIFRSTDPLLRSQTHALYIAKVIMEYVRLGSPYIQKHCLVDWFSSGADSLGPTQQAVIQAVAQEGASTLTGEGPFRFFTTPSASAIEMYCKYFGTEVIPSEFSYMDYMDNGVKKYSSLASKDEEGNIYLAVVNIDREFDKRMNIVVEGTDLTNWAVTAYTLQGDSYDAANTLEDPDNVKIETEEWTAEKPEVVLNAGKHSFVILKMSPVASESITLSQESLQLKTGEMATLTAEVFPENTTDKTIVWESENPEIATVEEGVVTGVTPGTTKITAATVYGTQAVCNVVVTEEEKEDTGNTPGDSTGGTTEDSTNDPVNKPSGGTGDNNNHPVNKPSGGTGDNNNHPVNKPSDGTGSNTNNQVNQPGNLTGESTNDDNQPPTAHKKGQKFEVAGASYKITKTGEKSGEVEFAKAPSNKKTVKVPATVSLEGITYKVTSIGKNAFKNNKTVTKVNIGKNVKSIGNTAFSNCAKLTSITIPKNVVKLGNQVFKGSKKLKKIVFKATKLKEKDLAKKVFAGISKTTKIQVPKKQVKAYKKMFQSKGLSKSVSVTK